MYLMDMINFFGDVDGFRNVLERLSDGSRPTSFHALRLFVRSLYNVREHLLPAFVRDYASGLVGTWQLCFRLPILLHV